MATKTDSAAAILFDPRYDRIEDRLDHVEKEIRQLREEISRPGILTLPEAALFSLKSPAPQIAADLSHPSGYQAVLSWGLDIARWALSIAARLLRFCLVPWVRNIVFGFLTMAILFSDWWLPFSGIWILGALWERTVLLLMAGVWWWLLAMYFAERPKKALVIPTAGPGTPSGASPLSGSPARKQDPAGVRAAGERFGARAG